MTRKKGNIFIGTSGWHYKHWKGTFYPKGLKEPQFLDYYIQFFSTVEINNSFYRLPGPETFYHWKQAAPEKFQFSVKASRYITHMKKLSDSAESLKSLLDNVKLLEDNLGVILFQLPPGWKCNVDRFKEFIKALPNEYRYAFEFRNPTWYNDTIYEALSTYNIAFCIYEIEYHLSPLVTTADFVYVRLHGPEGKYAGSYNNKTLHDWAAKCYSWQKEGKDVYFYFDNDQLGYAAFNAITLKGMVKGLN